MDDSPLPVTVREQWPWQPHFARVQWMADALCRRGDRRSCGPAARQPDLGISLPRFR